LRRLNDAITNLFKHIGAMRLEPVQNISRQLSIVWASLDNPQFPGRDFHPLEPFCKLKCQQLAEQRARTHTRKKIARPSNLVLFLFIISTIGTIKGQLHKTPKRDDTFSCNFRSNFLDGINQVLVVWCGFSYQLRWNIQSLWQKSTLSSI